MGQPEGILVTDKTNDSTVRWVLAATVLASGMAFLDWTIVSVALPKIQAELDTNVAGLQWVIDAYALSVSALLLTCGAFGDHLGRRRTFSIGILVFVLGSLLCALSVTIEQLILARGFQGIGAALMIPGSLAIISAAIPEAHRGRAIGTWAGFSGSITAFGPLAGGYLVQTFNWESIFYVNLPLGTAAYVMTLRFVPESRDPGARSIDWLGTVAITVALFGVAYGTIEGPLRGWGDPLVVAALVGGPIFLHSSS